MLLIGATGVATILAYRVLTWEPPGHEEAGHEVASGEIPIPDRDGGGTQPSNGAAAPRSGVSRDEEVQRSDRERFLAELEWGLHEDPAQRQFVEKNILGGDSYRDSPRDAPLFTSLEELEESGSTIPAPLDEKFWALDKRAMDAAAELLLSHSKSSATDAESLKVHLDRILSAEDCNYSLTLLVSPEGLADYPW